ncbi:MAG: hypothetical protein NW203_13195, partial [Hyphomonadaceae bacterium]|nr:hypothetical protein [Hyphomonadaceae bacterium]
AAPPTALALEPGDAVQLDAAAGVFEITRIEDAEARMLSLRRARAPAGLIAHGGETRSGGLDGPAPTPDVAVLDLPLLPGAGDDQRPFAAVYASPWRGPHRVYVDAAMRGEARALAAIGRLAWPLYPGPVGRWDEGNRFQAVFPDAAFSSATRAALLNGANAFAVEGAGGLWEVIQARDIALVGPRTYLFSGLLRGALGSEAAMASPAPAGARIVRLDSALVRLEVRAHEWGEALRLAVPPAGRAASDPAAAVVETALPRIAAKALAPAHVRAARLPGGDIAVRWVRRARLDGDGWGPGEPPLGAEAESYRVEILNAGVVVRTFTPASPAIVYSAADQVADFGAPPSILALRVGQIGGDGAIGFMAESVLAV